MNLLGRLVVIAVIVLMYLVGAYAPRPISIIVSIILVILVFLFPDNLLEKLIPDGIWKHLVRR